MRYGDAALDYLKSHGGRFVLVMLVLVLLLYVLTHFVFRSPAKKP